MDELYSVLHDVARKAKGGIPGMADRLAKKHQTLLNKLNPIDDHAEPKISEFVMIMRDAKSTRPLEILCQMFGGRFVTRSSKKTTSTLAALLSAINEHSDIVRAYEQAMDDGELSASERAQILKEIGEARDALSVLENHFLDHSKG
ncbi:MAG: phage regulatory CII family protein [Candidatus Thiodiazotropha sp.]